MDYEATDPEFETHEPEAYEDGRVAFRRSIDRDQCPYTNATECELWEMGWDEACTESEEEL